MMRLAWSVALAASLLSTTATYAEAATFTRLSPADGTAPCTIVMEGEIVDGDLERFGQALLPNPAAGQERFSDAHFKDLASPEVLCLNSDGGNVEVAVSIIETMYFAGKAKVTLETRVRTGDRCHSACALIFMAGMGGDLFARDYKRTIEPGASLAFHSFDIPDFDIQTTPAMLRETYRSALSNVTDMVAAFQRLNHTRPEPMKSPQWFPSWLLLSVLGTPPESLFFLNRVDALFLAGISVDQPDPNRTEITWREAFHLCANLHNMTSRSTGSLFLDAPFYRPTDLIAQAYQNLNLRDMGAFLSYSRETIPAGSNEALRITLDADRLAEGQIVFFSDCEIRPAQGVTGDDAHTVTLDGVDHGPFYLFSGADSWRLLAGDVSLLPKLRLDGPPMSGAAQTASPTVAWIWDDDQAGDQIYDAAVATADGGSIVVGQETIDGGNAAALILRVASDGSISWDLRLSELSDSELGRAAQSGFYGIAPIDDGTFVASGFLVDPGSTVRHGLTLRFTDAGDLLFYTIEPTGHGGDLTSVQGLDRGGVASAGTATMADGTTNPWIVLRDADSDILRAGTIDIAGSVGITAMARADESLLLAGWLAADTLEESLGWFAKVGLDGLLPGSFVRRTDYTSEVLLDIALSETGKVILAGFVTDAADTPFGVLYVASDLETLTIEQEIVFDTPSTIRDIEDLGDGAFAVAGTVLSGDGRFQTGWAGIGTVTHIRDLKVARFDNPAILGAREVGNVTVHRQGEDALSVFASIASQDGQRWNGFGMRLTF